MTSQCRRACQIILNPPAEFEALVQRLSAMAERSERICVRECHQEERGLSSRTGAPDRCKIWGQSRMAPMNCLLLLVKLVEKHRLFSNYFRKKRLTGQKSSKSSMNLLVNCPIIRKVWPIKLHLIFIKDHHIFQSKCKARVDPLGDHCLGCKVNHKTYPRV